MFRRTSSIAGAIVCCLLLTAPIGRASEEHAHTGSSGAKGLVGVLLVDHGEPPEYNELTYYSFREFFDHLIEMGLIPAWLKTLDTGTILSDRDCYDCDGQRPDAKFIDAWLRPHAGPATYVPRSSRLPAHYVMAGGPGMGEPDIFEHVGLGAWDEWRRMGGRSPNYDQKLPRKQAVEQWLRAAYGDRVAVRIGYGIDPRLGGGRQGVREAVDALVRTDRVRHIVVAYHGVGFSDIMQTHMLRHQIVEQVRSLDTGIGVSFTAPVGTTAAYLDAVEAFVLERLRGYPKDAAVAVHLSGHGLPTGMCGDYNCGADAYHESARRLFAAMKARLDKSISRPGRTGVFNIFADGSTGDDDPENKVDGPIEALDKRVSEGYQHVLDVPYEFDADSRDTLIVLRRAYGRTPPDWGAGYESSFTYRGLDVRITNSQYGGALKAEAYRQVVADALAPLLGAPPAAAAAAHGHRSAGVLGHQTHAPAAVASHDTVHPAATAEAASEHGHEDESGPLAAMHRHVHDAVQAPLAFVLAGLAGALFAVAAVRGRHNRLGSALLAGLGVVFAGLAWDVAAHAAEAHPVHLLENGGHWLSALGIGVIGAAAGILTFRRQHAPDDSVASSASTPDEAATDELARTSFSS